LQGRVKEGMGNIAIYAPFLTFPRKGGRDEKEREETRVRHPANLDPRTADR
jgi:hypothetical protein